MGFSNKPDNIYTDDLRKTSEYLKSYSYCVLPGIEEKLYRWKKIKNTNSKKVTNACIVSEIE